MSSADIIANELEESSKNNLNGKLVLLKGVWGSGKTYRWENKIKPAIKRKNKIYISLFGMQNVDEVKQELYLKAIDCKYSNIFFKIILSIIFFVFAISIFGCVVYNILFSDFSQLRVEIQATYIIILICALILSIWLFSPVKKSILLYFLNTTLGLNYNTVSLAKLLPPEETVICFDDFERIAKAGHPDTFLGYFNTLARTYGYHILFIAYITKEIFDKKPNKATQDSKEVRSDQYLQVLLDYQEKVFDKIFEHEQSLIEILEQKDINVTLKKYLFELINNLQNKYSPYDEEAVQYIEKIRGNIRFISKIIDNMNIVYRYVSADELNTNGIHDDVIKFVCGLTLAIETGYCSSIDDIYTKGLHHVFWTQSSERKTFTDFLAPYMSNIYNSLYDLIYKGIKSEEFEGEILPNKKMTSFEKAIYQFSSKYYLEYRSTELKEQYTEIQDILIKSDILFSSYSEALKVLGRYCWLLSCMNKNLESKTKAKQKIFSNIQKIIEEEQPQLRSFDRISFNITADSNDFKISERIIIMQIYKCMVDSYIKNLPKSKIVEYFLDYNENKDKSIQDIIYIILMSDDKYVNLQKIAEADYSTFIKIWRKLGEYSFSFIEYQKLCQVMGYDINSYINLLNKFNDSMKKLAKGMPEKSPEMMNYTQFQRDFEKRLQAFNKK